MADALIFLYVFKKQGLFDLGQEFVAQQRQCLEKDREMTSIRSWFISATYLASVLAPAPLFAKDSGDWLVKLAGNVEHQALREVDIPAARAKLLEAGRNIRPEDATSFDKCAVNNVTKSLADTVAVLRSCARFTKLSDAVKAKEEKELARLLVASSGFSRDKFLDASEIEKLFARTSPARGVIGLSLKSSAGKIDVVQSYPGSPAREAGIGPGWQLVSIDGRVYSGKERDDAAVALAGEIGSTASLGLVDPKGMAREVVLRRIKAAQIDWNIDSHRVGGTLTLQIYEFTQGTGDKVEALIANERSELSRIVLDLRGNVGGLLDEAILIADQFLDHGTIAIVRGRQKVEMVYKANAASIAPNAQLIVLVDGETAAGAELLAATLADNARATVLGEPTRGVGTIRTVSLYARDAAVVLTTQELIRPNGEPIEGRGVRPQGPPDSLDFHVGGTL